jgi:predicted metal-dependent hydrolase
VAPEAWRLGVRLFEAGEYWECHEALEPAWLSSSGTEKRFLGGVILLAAALHKARRMGSARGGRRNYAKALAKLALVSDHHHGVDVRELEARVHRALRDRALRPAIPFVDAELKGETLECDE